MGPRKLEFKLKPYSFNKMYIQLKIKLASFASLWRKPLRLGLKCDLLGLPYLLRTVADTFCVPSGGLETDQRLYIKNKYFNPSNLLW